MKIRLLGTSAGGGFPQWNCNCPNCAAARAGLPGAQARTQSCIALSADGARWFLLNASPDLPTQIRDFPPLWPTFLRHTPIEGVLLSSADLDHSLGLVLMREGAPIHVHTSAAIRETLTAGPAKLLDNYCGIQWNQSPDALSDLCDSQGKPSGLQYKAFAVPGHPPRYGRADPGLGDVLGYRFVDAATGGAAVMIPGIAALNHQILDEIEGCKLLLLDGTFWSDDELVRLGAGIQTATAMGHLPIGGPGGSLQLLGGSTIGQKIYIHLNNTNPVLCEHSSQRAQVEAAGWKVASDGWEFEV